MKLYHLFSAIYFLATPKVPNIWSNWSVCTSQCRQERRLECHNGECDVVVIESRRCYDKCGHGMYASVCGFPCLCQPCIKSAFNRWLTLRS
jgi:hypothetical protein